MRMARIGIYLIVLLFLGIYGNHLLVGKRFGTIDYGHPEKYENSRISGFVELKVVEITDNGFKGVEKGIELTFIGDNSGLTPGDICVPSGYLILPYTIRYDRMIIYSKWKRQLIVIISITVCLFVFLLTLKKRREFR